jgi:hypothetical protein
MAPRLYSRQAYYIVQTETKNHAAIFELTGNRAYLKCANRCIEYKLRAKKIPAKPGIRVHMKPKLIQSDPGLNRLTQNSIIE